MALTISKTRHATLLDDREPARASPAELVESRSPLTSEVVQSGERPSGRHAEHLNPDLADERATSCPVDTLNPLVNDARPQPTSPLAAPARKMDSSQSPTQSNDARSYEQYLPRSSQQGRTALHADDAEHPTLNTQSTQHDQRSLADDDTGAVVFNFDDPAATYPEHNSLISEVASPLVDVGSLTRQRGTFARAAQISQTDDLPPETPAVSKNPFGGNNRVQLVPTSQLFKATQYSSAFRGASPTSSRPSPNDFPHDSISPNPISSPLKARGLRSSPTAGALSSPQVLQATDEQATPLNSYTEDRLGPGPRYGPLKTRSAPEPIGVYVPMRQSQERRSSSVVASDSGSVELSDDDDDPIDRRRRVQSKKKASLERLTPIQFSRTPKTEKVEVPSTNTKKRKKSRTEAEKYVDQCYGRNLSDDDTQVEERVEDSQGQPAITNKPIILEDQDLTQSTQGEVMGPPDGTIMRSSTVSAPPRTSQGRKKPGLRTKNTDSSLVPETSPVRKERSQYFTTPGATPGATPSTLALAASSNNAVVASSGVEKDLPDAPASSVTEFVPQVVASIESLTGGVRPASPGFTSPVREPEVGEENDRSSPDLPSILPELTAQNVRSLPSSPPAPAFSTRSKKRQYDAFLEPKAPTISPITEPPLTERIDQNASMSTLSSLSTTPTVSQATTAPATEESVATAVRRRADVESPVVAKNKRRRGAEGLPRLPILSTTESLRTSTRLSRQQRSVSTDELARSPSSTPTFEQSLRAPTRLSATRLSRVSTRDLQSARELSTSVQRPGKLFEGMAFAVSFQAKKPGENPEQQAERMEFAKALEARIIQAGGKLLSGGFDELFEASPVKSAGTSPVSSSSSQAEEEVKLTSSARNIGFTALIADGHSRKVKYMQALALGLPCLAPRWITTCLDREEIVDWAPYLLCAGQSAFLGGAYRSRNLAPYDATTARLSEIVQSRAQLLKDDRILLVMKKSEHIRKGPYVFLARILGASLCRVHSIEEARGKMKQMEALRQPFDWVYVDDKVDKGELFEADGYVGPNSKKRKSRGGNNQTTGGSEGASKPPKKIRTLSDELVIQSLILGRLIADGEMED